MKANRARILGFTVGFALVISAIVFANPPATLVVHDTKESILDSLLEGNNRFATGTPAHPHQDGNRRGELAKGQKPDAIVVTCSDSRVVPEFIFDQGLGDLFVVRVAGNTLDNVALGTIDYAVEHLGTRLIIVMGHERCGAVSAALSGEKFHGCLNDVVKPIVPAATKAKIAGDEALDFAVKENVRNMVRALTSEHDVTSELCGKNELQIAGMRYDLDSGRASLIMLL